MRRLTVIGLGLIGASSLRGNQKACDRLDDCGYSRTEATRQQAVARGLIDQSFGSIVDAVAGADLVLIAVPMGPVLIGIF